MKKISLCIVLVLVFSVFLIAQESEPSEIVGYVAYPCVEGTTGNNNFISVPLHMVDAEGDTLRTLNDLGNSFRPSEEDDPLVDGISFWVAATQSWDGISWNEAQGQWFGNPVGDLWPLLYGSSYMISITEELTFYSVGSIPEPIHYLLEEGTTGNNNFIMVPLDRADISTLNALGDDIAGDDEGLVDGISFWVATTQSWDGISWNEAQGQWFGNPIGDLWPAYIGMPLMVSVTEETQWPGNGERQRADRRRYFEDRRMR